MVDLDPLDEEDVITLSQLLSEHQETTGSTVARFILGDLENQRANFIKVYPRDYKKVMMNQKSATNMTIK
jgi:glutamate synthase (NADPH/NADH) large chain